MVHDIQAKRRYGLSAPMSESPETSSSDGSRLQFTNRGPIPPVGREFRSRGSPTDQAYDAKPIQFLGKDADPSVEGTNAEGLNQEVMEGDPFVQGDGDVHKISPNDVDQGHLGDCWLLAGLMAIARTHPELIENMIKPLVMTPGRWAVTFHFPTFTGSFEQETVVVDARVPVKSNADGGGPFFARAGDKRDTKNELWVLLIEKAYAKTQGKYGNINGSKSPHGSQAMEIVSGKTNGRIDPGADEDTLLNELDLAFRLGRKAVTLGTISANHPNAGLAKVFPSVRRNHAYALDNVDKVGRSLYLLDPWGYGHVSLDIARVKKLVDQIHVNG